MPSLIGPEPARGSRHGRIVTQQNASWRYYPGIPSAVSTPSPWLCRLRPADK